jgi:hypothetical protein
MKRHALLSISTFGLLTAFFLAAGCITISAPGKTTPPPATTPGISPPATAPEARGDLPTIISFAASPEAATVGQAVTLNWDVSDATLVSIQPAVGTVNTSGMQTVSPTRTITYILTASNAAGPTMKSLTVTVTAPVALPDLVVTEVTIPGAIIFYKVKNLGDGAATIGSQSYLYLNGAKVATDYIEPLAPGKERLESFSNYTAYLGGSDDLYQTLKVCADAESQLAETSEDNNCAEIVWGPTFIYDFAKQAPLALWRSGAGELKWPMVGGDAWGAAFINHQLLEDGRSYADTLAMYPQQVQSGSIQGNFGQIYSENYMQTTRLKEITVPPLARFTARVGYVKGADGISGSTVSFGIIDQSGSLVFLKTQDIYYDGALDDINVDLSHLANKKVYFVLRVESKGNGAKDWVVWAEPKVILKQ